MRARSLACGLATLAALAAGGCADPGPGRPFLAGAGLATDLPASAPAREAAKLISRSVWGVVPVAPRRKGDLRPGLIRGSAVAVAADTLLAACRVVRGRERVGIVRHGKYHLARVGPRRGGEGVCELRAPGAPLEPVRGSRDLAGLPAGEPVYAIFNRDSSRFALAEVPPGGQRPGRGLELPLGPLSVVLFDGRGNLLGLAAPGAVREARPGGAALAPSPPRTGG